jgi:enoyl-CoA hydratase/carnithine racemase
MTYTTIIVDRSGPVATVTLNRPSALNAINGQMLGELEAAFAELNDDSAVRVIIVTGAGRAFSAGRDAKEIGAASHRSAAELWNQMERLPKPLIAAVNGLCYTGALSMLLCFDLVVASEAATFADTHAKFGMRHGGGTTQRLRNAIGAARAKELLFTCEPIDAREAYQLGLVNRVVAEDELLGTASRLAASISRNDPDAIAATKMTMNHGTKWGTAVGFEMEATEYRQQRRSVASGAAAINVQVGGGSR